MEDLPGLPEEQLRALRQACLHTTPRVTSAYALAPAMRASVDAALAALAGGSVVCDFEQDPRLIAGLRVSAGAWVLRCNLVDELALPSS
ncbi:F0F1 ATP synthase subunit delta [Bacillus velezensis]|uniref:F0F1 ATP synthase subunit delta n=1 Tax=Bacillus velezensis TaxID=492670 RepID=UPI0023E10524|nr:F0F1 ATP synthase subunit delta [Bacillus velezensis]WES02012.1 F0F1 ATP synthase subunit delta [Bacillus velezensis]